MLSQHQQQLILLSSLAISPPLHREFGEPQLALKLLIAEVNLSLL